MGKSKIIIIVLLVSLCGAWLYFSNQAEKNQIHAINKTMDEEYQTIVGILNQDYVSEAEWNQVSGKLGVHFDPNQYPEKYQKVVSRFFRKFISSASKYRHQMYGFSSSAGCSISILNRCSMSI